MAVSSWVYVVRVVVYVRGIYLFIFSVASCRRIMLGLLCKEFMSSMMHGSIKLMCLVFHVMM